MGLFVEWPSRSAVEEFVDDAIVDHSGGFLAYNQETSSDTICWVPKSLC